MASEASFSDWESVKTEDLFSAASPRLDNKNSSGNEKPAEKEDLKQQPTVYVEFPPGGLPNEHAVNETKGNVVEKKLKEGGDDGDSKQVRTTMKDSQSDSVNQSEDDASQSNLPPIATISPMKCPVPYLEEQHQRKDVNSLAKEDASESISYCSSLSSKFSMIRKIDALDINSVQSKSSCHKRVGTNTTTSSISSGVFVPNRLNDTSSNSSWSQYGTITSSFVTHDYEWPLTGTQPSDDITLGSLLSNFEIICSTTGQTVAKCKRCKFHNDPDATMCQSCNLALVANPCLDLDGQVAVYLQRKEEEKVVCTLQQRQLKRIRLGGESLFEQATSLANDIHYFVYDEFFAKVARKSADDREDHPPSKVKALEGQRISTGFQCLVEHDLMHLAADFINVVRSRLNGNISLAYKFKDINDWEIIRQRGFTDELRENGFVTVRRDLNGALALYTSEARHIRPRRHVSRNLFSINETSQTTSTVDTSLRSHKKHCWIVVIVEEDRFGLRNPDTSGFHSCVNQNTSGFQPIIVQPRHVLPLVFMDETIWRARNGRRSEIDTMFSGLSQVILDFFGYSLEETGFNDNDSCRDVDMSEGHEDNVDSFAAPAPISTPSSVNMIPEVNVMLPNAHEAGWGSNTSFQHNTTANPTHEFFTSIDTSIPFSVGTLPPPNHCAFRIPQVRKKKVTSEPLQSTKMVHLQKKYMSQLEYMRTEFKKLERQLLGAKSTASTNLAESAGSRERREKLHSFIVHLEDTMNQIRVGCSLEIEGKSTLGSVNAGNSENGCGNSGSGTTGGQGVGGSGGISGINGNGAVPGSGSGATTTNGVAVKKEEEEAKAEFARTSALTKLTKEKEEEENVQKLEEHILANLLPVKERLTKQLAAQQEPAVVVNLAFFMGPRI